VTGATYVPERGVMVGQVEQLCLGGVGSGGGGGKKAETDKANSSDLKLMNKENGSTGSTTPTKTEKGDG